MAIAETAVTVVDACESAMEISDVESAMAVASKLRKSGQMFAKAFSDHKRPKGEKKSGFSMKLTKLTGMDTEKISGKISNGVAKVSEKMG